MILPIIMAMAMATMGNHTMNMDMDMDMDKAPMDVLLISQKAILAICKKRA
jgi:hypothetical protein